MLEGSVLGPLLAVPEGLRPGCCLALEPQCLGQGPPPYARRCLRRGQSDSVVDWRFVLHAADLGSSHMVP